MITHHSDLYNTSIENTFLIESNLPFRVKIRNLSPVSTFCHLYFTWYGMLYLFYANTVSSHQSEEFLLLLPPNSLFLCCSRRVYRKSSCLLFRLNRNIPLLNISHFHMCKLPHCFSPNTSPPKCKTKIPTTENQAMYGQCSC